ncbi:NAD-P-binding protein [Mycena vulgaris]|nr:NAD-P-binding protein [Mycena vulgaris]
MSLPQTTKHYYFPQVGDGALDALTTASSPLPRLQPTEALVKVHAVSLQARDLLIAKGVIPTIADLIPCSDMAGEIVAVGDAVHEWKTGDRVCSSFSLDFLGGELKAEMLGKDLGASIPGVLTEYRIFPDHSLVRIPPHLSYDEASTLPCAALTAFSALRGLDPVKGGDTVLIPGTGGVATFALQFAAAMGAKTIVMSSSDQKLLQAKALGATHVLNYNATPTWDAEAQKLTNGVGVDLVLQLAGPETLVRSMNAVRISGNIAIISGAFSNQTNFPDIMTPSIMKGLKFRGIQVGSIALFREMNAFISEHKIRPMIAKIFRFEEARKAYDYLESQTHVGKVVIRI